MMQLLFHSHSTHYTATVHLCFMLKSHITSDLEKRKSIGSSKMRIGLGNLTRLLHVMRERLLTQHESGSRKKSQQVFFLFFSVGARKRNLHKTCKIVSAFLYVIQSV